MLVYQRVGYILNDPQKITLQMSNLKVSVSTKVCLNYINYVSIDSLQSLFHTTKVDSQNTPSPTHNVSGQIIATSHDLTPKCS